ncbi:hypothetical protein QAD02_014251, partial [Eretmocerus hayati]
AVDNKLLKCTRLRCRLFAMDEDSYKPYTKDEIRNLGRSEFFEYLELIIDDEEIRRIFEENCITGKSFFELEQSDLIDVMKMKLGPAKEILSIIRAFNDEEKKLLKTTNSVDCSEDGTSKLEPKNLKRKLESTPIAQESCSVSNSLEGEKANTDHKTRNGSLRSHVSRNSDNTSKFSSFRTIRETLKNHPQGSGVLNALDSKNKIFPEPMRKKLNQIVVDELVKTQSPYPAHEAKLALAIALVTEFPRLKDHNADLGYERFYNPITKMGSFHYRLQVIQNNLPFDQRRYNTTRSRSSQCTEKNNTACSSKNLILLSEEELKMKLSLLCGKNPDSIEHKKTILTVMDDTFFNRRDWTLGSQPTVSQILSIYSPLKDLDGSEMDSEFNRLFKGNGDFFIAKFPCFYKKRVIKYVQFAQPGLLKIYENESDESLKVLLLMVALLRTPNSVINPTKSRKCANENQVPKESSQSSVNQCEMKKPKKVSDYLILTSDDGTDVETFVKQRRNAEEDPIQPYIYRVKNNKSSNYFVIAQDTIFNRKPNTDIISAFDLLFKVFQVFNLSYPPHLTYFYHFMETYIYKTRTFSNNVLSSLQLNLEQIIIEEEESMEENLSVI